MIVIKRAILKIVVFATLAFSTALFWPDSASAQMRVCGPGEEPVAFDKNVNPPAPLCYGNNAPPEEPAPTFTYAPAGMAYHVDADDVWIVGFSAGAGSQAMERAIEACNKTMGGGCEGGAKWWHSNLKTYRDAYGYIHFARDLDGSGARKKMLEGCNKNQFLPCLRVGNFPSKMHSYLPGPEARKLYAATSSVDAMGKKGSLYIASGQSTLEAAQKLSREACAKANPGQKCIDRTFTGNGFIQSVMADDLLIAPPETSAARAQDAAKAACKREKAKRCILGAIYDSRKPGVFVHQYSQ